MRRQVTVLKEINCASRRRQKTTVDKSVSQHARTQFNSLARRSQVADCITAFVNRKFIVTTLKARTLLRLAEVLKLMYAWKCMLTVKLASTGFRTLWTLTIHNILFVITLIWQLSASRQACIYIWVLCMSPHTLEYHLSNRLLECCKKKKNVCHVSIEEHVHKRLNLSRTRYKKGTILNQVESDSNFRFQVAIAFRMLLKMVEFEQNRLNYPDCYMLRLFNKLL